MNKFFLSVLASVTSAAIISVPVMLWKISSEQHKTNERLVRIETKIGITIANNP